MPIHSSQFRINTRMNRNKNINDNVNENQESNNFFPPIDVNDSAQIMIAGGINRTNLVTKSVDNYN